MFREKFGLKLENGIPTLVQSGFTMEQNEIINIIVTSAPKIKLQILLLFYKSGSVSYQVFS